MNNLHTPATHASQHSRGILPVLQLAHRLLLAWLLACLLMPVEVVWSADKAASSEVVQTTSSSVNPETLNARLDEVEASTSLDDETRASITELINKALANLETARNNKVTTEEYIRLRESAPEMTRKIRDVQDKRASVPPEVKLTVTRESPFEEIEREL